MSNVRIPVRVGLVALALFALSACAYLSGQNQSCPPVTDFVDPSTVALPPAPKPAPKDEVEPQVASAAASTPDPQPAADAMGDAGVAAQDGGTAMALAQKPAAPKPKPAVAGSPSGAGDATCGDRANPCPMQKFMRTTMGAASTPEALTAAFTRAASLSPNGGWAWRSIAQKGAELAKGGDAAAAKKQCKA